MLCLLKRNGVIPPKRRRSLNRVKPREISSLQNEAAKTASQFSPRSHPPNSAGSRGPGLWSRYFSFFRRGGTHDCVDSIDYNRIQNYISGTSGRLVSWPVFTGIFDGINRQSILIAPRGLSDFWWQGDGEVDPSSAWGRAGLRRPFRKYSEAREEKCA